jgi:hypothetical protein
VALKQDERTSLADMADAENARMLLYAYANERYLLIAFALGQFVTRFPLLTADV